MKYFFSLFLIWTIFLPGPILAQELDPWDILADTEFTQKYFEEEEASFLAPNFGDLTKAYEGKTFEISGFLIPLDPGNNEYILSKYPYASCFFCGGAGPESVIELNFDEESLANKDYQIDEYLRFSGTLVLNETDIFRMNFILENAREVED